MNLSSLQITYLFVICILCISTAAIFFLRRLKPNNTLFQKVERIVRSWWLIAGSFLLALAWQRWGIIIFMYLVTLFALNEYLKVSKVPHKTYLKGMMLALTSLQYVLIAQDSFTAFLCALPILCLWVVPVLVICCATVQNLELITSVGVGLVLLVYYTSHIAALGAFPQLQLTPDESVFAIFILLLTTWLNDVFQFMAGNAFGKRKIVPAISPNKTLGGFIGGILGTAMLTWLATPPLLHLTSIEALGLGVVISITGMFGDLFFSAIKRNVGVKDFSNALPGHGGLLDRLDSLVFTSPIFFYYLLLIRG